MRAMEEGIMEKGFVPARPMCGVEKNGGNEMDSVIPRKLEVEAKSQRTR